LEVKFKPSVGSAGRRLGWSVVGRDGSRVSLALTGLESEANPALERLESEGMPVWSYVGSQMGVDRWKKS